MEILSRLWRQLRGVTPFSITLLFAFLAQMPLEMPVAVKLMPSLTLMAAFYWTLYRPDLLPPSAIFIVGLIEDLISGNILGLTALILLGTYALLLNQRRMFLGKPFSVTWFGFAVIAGMAIVAHWVIASVFFWRLQEAISLACQYIVSVGLFPLVVWLFVGTHRHILPRTD